MCLIRRPCACFSVIKKKKKGSCHYGVTSPQQAETPLHNLIDLSITPKAEIWSIMDVDLPTSGIGMEG
ncbi:hypothetical protein ANANG_G00069200 [Anguilla anguilla]|uniref:Uncharacterized protein n=1 Tax=Anguilla anguilla TaxID=7936 RepID=A0A9D3MS71_ANGAN|nr:hypothetical protein ANANG_G00069200 [Anguilla anguilla]